MKGTIQRYNGKLNGIYNLHQITSVNSFNGQLRDVAVLFMRIQNLITILEIVCEYLSDISEILARY